MLTVDTITFVASKIRLPVSLGNGREQVKEDATAPVAENDDEDWTPLEPHLGSLSRGNQRIYIRVWNDRLGLRYIRSSKRGDMTAWIWDGRGDGEMDFAGMQGGRRRVRARALLDVLKGGGEGGGGDVNL